MIQAGGRGDGIVASEQSTPKALGDYILLTKIAAGGMATVYVGCKRGAAGFERLVAIKCCHPHLRDSEDFVSMFMDEARLAAGIRHPNVVGTLDVSDGDTMYLVMDYVEGATLMSLIRRSAEAGKRFPVEAAVHVMKDVLAGLQAAHDLRGSDGELLNLVHRDVSPHNILVGLDGVSRITDFGIAFAAARSSMTREGEIKGKFSYIAPEQILAGQVTRQMDIFSAGIVLWEALAGRLLFRRTTDAETIGAVLNDEIPLPSRYNKAVPAELDAIVLKALSRDPVGRYSTASEFREAIDAVSSRSGARLVRDSVEELFGKDLAHRREVLRTSPKIPLDFGPVTGVRRVSSDQVATDPLPPPRPSSIAPSELQHRRMRGLLAAIMLLLVGSALGLLLNNEGRSGKTPAGVSK